MAIAVAGYRIGNIIFVCLPGAPIASFLDRANSAAAFAGGSISIVAESVEQGSYIFGFDPRLMLPK
jgi:hypothetical protein